MINILAFIISLVCIVLFLYFRLWEINRGERIFNVRRKKLDEKIISFNAHIQRNMPIIDSATISRIYHVVVHYFALIVLNVLKIIEGRMIFLLEYVRGKREIKRGITKSNFLKQVNEHKKNLENKTENVVE